jgi:CubicO group peptidase (beta-lactamase class C family)
MTTPEALLGEIKPLIEQIMAEWQVPGLGLAVVRGQRPILIEAFGFRDVEAGQPATTSTHFAICSLTKSFTAAGLAMLVAERKLEWDKPVRTYMPEFRMRDPIATERLAVIDMLTHRSGLPRHDWVHLPGQLSRAQMLAALAHLEPSRDFRIAYQYQNLLYNAAGMLAERITGRSWEEFTRARLLEPLGMKDTAFCFADMLKAADFAWPYAIVEEERRRAPLREIRAAPAGSITASIAAMANYLRFHLELGNFAGRALLSAASAQLMQSPLMYCGRSEHEEIGDLHYGLGFEISQYGGERIVQHGGGAVGWGSLMTMVPKRGVGTVILTNRSPSPVPHILGYTIIERLCGLPQGPWLERMRKANEAGKSQREQNRQARSTARAPATTPSHPLPDYVGSYEHPAYGRVAIEIDGDRLAWRGLDCARTLHHRHFDIFEFPDCDTADIDSWLAALTVSFRYDREGNIDRLAVPLEPLVADIVFRRVPDSAPCDRSFLETCAGTYQSGMLKHVVALDADGQLTLSSVGQRTHCLGPYRGTTFALRELPGFRVEFRRDPSGIVEAIIFHQPNGTFIARRVEAAP